MKLETTIETPMNDVHSDNFVSMLDPAFRADCKGYRWPEGARSRPRMVEIGMVWTNKNTRKVNWIT